MILAATIRPQPFRQDHEQATEVNGRNSAKDEGAPVNTKQSFASSIRKSLLNHSIRKIKKRKSILNGATNPASNLEFIEEDGALSTENGDLAILVEFDLDSNFKFIPFRSELNNLIANNFASNLLFNSHSSISMSSLHSQSHLRAQANKSIVSFLSQLKAEQLPELLLQRIAFCNEHSELWRKQIKLAHDIIPKPPPLRAIRPPNQLNSLTDASGRHRVQRANSLAVPNGHHSDPHHSHNNNDSKLVCLCERCQFRRINGLNQDCKMPTMDNILLRTNEFNSLSNVKPSVISQLFNR